MIYNCWSCGWRINDRTGCDKNGDAFPKTWVSPENVGKYLLHDHKAFCSRECICVFKDASVYKQAIRKPPSDYWENGVCGNWKIQRKINRVRKNRRPCI